MECWSVQRRIFCVEQFMLIKLIVSVQWEFRRKFGDDLQRGAAPSRKIIGQWVHQWRETGSVQVKARTCRSTVRWPENIQRVRIALERRVMTVSLWKWTPNVITTCWKPCSYLRWDVTTGIWWERGFNRTVPQPIRYDSQWTPYVLHSPGDFSLGLVTSSGPPIHRTLLQHTFFMGAFESSSFYSHPPWH